MKNMNTTISRISGNIGLATNSEFPMPPKVAATPMV